ncbi:MAG: recombination regulator RecX [Candidatus Accumulibacter phosphatis]|jgi:regulatory protein|uniref:Regulatory protein RecX n=2 Tax=Candidatus Accumulibacter TaxID=327159 RepID=A0A080M1C8_9PROT|nr:MULTISPECIES: recombination regulator RecX [Candidatus Accumulibacter]KFB70994.1 MAG: Regulatory protein RecX [Candidatus Accumulibacter phosphatis]MBL8406923.1 recombination regulator RecX [Accumulibacter sp.]NMQ06796.1 recombination regulator RecX [Candidatus Accumulibacter contiguus]HRF13961.1 recombination regulator RecX [Candidatus Accumulibacter phosphatis]
MALRERALRLLAQREYTRQELSRKIAPLAESAEQLEVLLDDLTRIHLLSDERYAEARRNSRAPRLGDARLAYELRSRGVAAELVRTTLAAGEDELTRARRVWQRRFGNIPADTVERTRQMRFLAGRGFSGETIRRLLSATLEDD